MGSNTTVNSFPNLGEDNFAMNDEDVEEKKIVRSNTTLSEVDLDILSKQNIINDEKVIQQFELFTVLF